MKASLGPYIAHLYKMRYVGEPVNGHLRWGRFSQEGYQRVLATEMIVIERALSLLRPLPTWEDVLKAACTDRPGDLALEFALLQVVAFILKN